MKGGEIIDKVAVVISVVGVLISLVFLYLTFKKNDRQDVKKKRKHREAFF